MPNPPIDPHADVDYRALVEALAREGLPRRAEAARTLEAVVCALSQRLADPHYAPLLELLPSPLRTRLLPCERHARAPRSPACVEEVYGIVAEDLGLDAREVEPAFRAVMAAIRALLTEDEAEEIAGRLPLDLLPLWRRPS